MLLHLHRARPRAAHGHFTAGRVYRLSGFGSGFLHPCSLFLKTLPGRTTQDTMVDTAAPGPLSFLNLEEVEEMAKAALPQMAYDYYRGGSDTGSTVGENRRAFAHYHIVPRMLVDVSRMDLSTTLWGMRMSAPILVAPMAMHGLGHPGREVATCTAAAAAGIPFVFSTVATSSLEEIAAVQHGSIIFQLYVVRNRAVVQRWVTEAERRGFKALMVTVDAQRLGRREADERNRFSLPQHLQLKNLQYLDEGTVTQARDSAAGSGLMALFGAQVDDSLTWEFLPWLRSITSLPIIVKGIVSPADALTALRYGVDGIVVSNHGGRQMDYAPAPITVLPEIVAAVAGRVPVLMDGGVRRGTDVLKALALGASAVLVGRPVLYGLALGGAAGVERVLSLLKAELELAMALAGCPSLTSVTPGLLRAAPGFSACGLGLCAARSGTGAHQDVGWAAAGVGGGRGAAAGHGCCSRCAQPVCKL